MSYVRKPEYDSNSYIYKQTSSCEENKNLIKSNESKLLNSPLVKSDQEYKRILKIQMSLNEYY